MASGIPEPELRSGLELPIEHVVQLKLIVPVHLFHGTLSNQYQITQAIFTTGEFRELTISDLVMGGMRVWIWI